MRPSAATAAATTLAPTATIAATAAAATVAPVATTVAPVATAAVEGEETPH